MKNFLWKRWVASVVVALLIMVTAASCVDGPNPILTPDKIFPLILYFLFITILVRFIIGAWRRISPAKTCFICGMPVKGGRILSGGSVCSKCYEEAHTHAPCEYRSVEEVRAVLNDPETFDRMTQEEKESALNKVFNEVEAKRQEDLQKKILASSAKMNTFKSESPSNIVRCPICGSTSISADKKGFGVGKAVVGAAIAGPIGLVGGNIGAKKVRVTCLNCGHQWIAGKAK